MCELNEEQKKRLKEKFVLIYYKSKITARKVGFTEEQENNAFSNVINELVEDACVRCNYDAQQKEEIYNFFELLKKELDIKYTRNRIGFMLYVNFLKLKN